MNSNGYNQKRSMRERAKNPYPFRFFEMVGQNIGYREFPLVIVKLPTMEGCEGSLLFGNGSILYTGALNSVFEIR